MALDNDRLVAAAHTDTCVSQSDSTRPISPQLPTKSSYQLALQCLDKSNGSLVEAAAAINELLPAGSPP
jgi:hypothetical protein